MRKYEDGVTLLKEILVKFPEHSEIGSIIEMLGDFYMELQNYDLALEQYERAIEWNPTNTQYYAKWVWFFLYMCAKKNAHQLRFRFWFFDIITDVSLIFFSQVCKKSALTPVYFFIFGFFDIIIEQAMRSCW